MRHTPPPRHSFTMKRRRGDFEDKRRKNKKGIRRYSHNATVKQQFWLPLYFDVTWNSNLRVVLFFFFCRSHKNWVNCRAQFFHQFYSRVVRKSKRNNNQKEEKRKNGGEKNQISAIVRIWTDATLCRCRWCDRCDITYCAPFIHCAISPRLQARELFYVNKHSILHWHPAYGSLLLRNAAYLAWVQHFPLL